MTLIRRELMGMLVAQPRRRRVRGLTGLCIALAIAGSADTAYAQETAPVQFDENASFSVERFRLSLDGDGILDVEGGATSGHMSWELGMWLGISDDPLVTYRAMDDGNERAGSLLSQRLGGTLMASIGLGTRVQVGLDIPIILYQDRPTALDLSPMGLAPVSTTGLGDARVIPKVQVLRQDAQGVDMAIIAAFTLPSSTADDYFGEATASFAPELAVSRVLGRFRLAGNLGYRVRKSSSLVNLQVNDEIFMRLGASYRLIEGTRPLELGLTLANAVAASAPFQQANQTYLEALAGLSKNVTQHLSGLVAAGIGLDQGFGTPDWRAVFGLRFRHGAAPPAAPLVVEPIPEPAPEPPPPPPPDTDTDGLIDANDGCVNEPGPQENRGCPWGDYDSDGLTDNLDKCLEQPEDMDSFQDEDGCPDLDNDSDGVMDTSDECVNQAGPLENRGCPDTDKDGDTVIDRQDNCPDEPGTVANHGCKARQLAVLRSDRIEILDAVYFTTNKAKISKRSFKLLDNVAKVLSAHASIQVRIEGHTDDRGNDAHNKKLSQERAEAVVQYLVSKGVEASRLEAAGFGEERPIFDNQTRKGRAANRRVEFHIVSTSSAEARPAAPESTGSLMGTTK